MLRADWRVLTLLAARASGYSAPRLLVAALAVLISAQVATAADIAPDAPDPIRAAFFDHATVTLHARSYLFDSSSDGDPGAAAWAIGGWAGYETGWIGDVLQFGVVGYTSQPLWSPQDREGSLLLLPDGSAISVLGQAYAALRYDGQVLTLYRQSVDQPEVNPHDNRMVPNTFEGATLGGNLGILSYYAGFLTSMKTRDADDFVNMAEVAGVDASEQMYLGGITLSPTEDVGASTSFYIVPNLLASSYSDGSWSLDLSGGSLLKLSGQFMIQTGIGEELLTGPDFTPWVLGIMANYTRHGLTLTVGYTANGSDDTWQAPYGMWPGYTNMLINEFNRAGEQAILLGASYDFADVGAAGLTAGLSVAVDTVVDDGLPMWTEYDLSAAYSFSSTGGLPAWLSPLSLSAQYGILQSRERDGETEMSDQLRLILNYEIKAAGNEF